MAARVGFCGDVIRHGHFLGEFGLFRANFAGAKQFAQDFCWRGLQKAAGNFFSGHFCNDFVADVNGAIRILGKSAGTIPNQAGCDGEICRSFDGLDAMFEIKRHRVFFHGGLKGAVEQVKEVGSIGQGGFDLENGCFEAVWQDATGAKGAYEASFTHGDNHGCGGNATCHRAGVKRELASVVLSETRVTKLTWAKGRYAGDDFFLVCCLAGKEVSGLFFDDGKRLLQVLKQGAKSLFAKRLFLDHVLRLGGSRCVFKPYILFHNNLIVLNTLNRNWFENGSLRDQLLKNASKSRNIFQ